MLIPQQWFRNCRFTRSSSLFFQAGKMKMWERRQWELICWHWEFAGVLIIMHLFRQNIQPSELCITFNGKLEALKVSRLKWNSVVFLPNTRKSFHFQTFTATSRFFVFSFCKFIKPLQGKLRSACKHKFACNAHNWSILYNWDKYIEFSRWVLKNLLIMGHLLLPAFSRIAKNW